VALKVVSMVELRLAVVLEPERTGETVAEVCRRHGISRESFYAYRRRYLAEGLAGLEPRSRRPLSSPARLEPALELEIVSLRRRHPRWGARRIRAELRRAGTDPPARSTIHRVLVRNALVAPQKPPARKASKRFERPLPNDLWQIDGTEVVLVCGERVWVIDVLDDHARFLLAASACRSLDGESAWACFCRASAAYGLPRQLLSDNGAYFSGRLRGQEVEFERRLAQLGVQLITSAPYHPQTLGKLERFHRTLKEWLADEAPLRDLAHLQTLLERFATHYNEERPHQGIADVTPAERYRAGWSAAAAVDERERGERADPSYPRHSELRKVAAHGVVAYDGLHIIVGKRWAGARVRIVESGELWHVYRGDELIRSLIPDRSRRYQTLGKRARRKAVTANKR
jgi:transposase InsO family protein